MTQEAWKRTPVKDLAVGDVVENPANGASERVTAKRPGRGSLVELEVTGMGWIVRNADEKLYKLFK